MHGSHDIDIKVRGVVSFLTYRSCFLLQATCANCPPGYYCDGSTQNDTYCAHGVQNPQPCPEGYYCPYNTRFDTEYACPNGTYNPTTKLETVDQCTACLPGMYCYSNVGLAYPTANCSGGYYCTEGASSPTPTDGTTGDICPTGSHCPEGSVSPTHCPPGTYNPTEGEQRRS